MTAITQHHDLIELRGLRASAAPVMLRALGGYLGCQVNDRTIFHLDEIGQASRTAPFQAIPFARPEDAEYLAAAWNAVPALLDHIDRLTEDNVRLREALDGYRAAVSFISADSWDGCYDCIDILKAARCADVDWDWAGDCDRIAAELKRIRPHMPPRQALTPAASEGK